MAKAKLDAQQSATTLRVALARLDIAERSVQQSIDAHRIVGRKYAGGLAAGRRTARRGRDRDADPAGARCGALFTPRGDSRALTRFGLDPGVLRSLDSAAIATPHRRITPRSMCGRTTCPIRTGT